MAGRKDISAGRAYVELFVKQNALSKGLNQAGKRLQSWGKSAMVAGAGVSGAGAALLAPLSAAVAHFAAAGDKLDKMSNRTRLSVSALSELEHVANATGTNIDQLGNVLFRSTRRIANAATGTGPAVRALDELNLSATDLANMGGEDRLYALVGALEGVENPGRRAQLAFEVFGDEAKAITPFLNQGVDGIKALRKEARDLGLSKTGDQAAAAAAVTDAIGRLKATLTATVFEIGAALAPAVLQALDLVQGIAVAAGRWIRENKSLVLTIAAIGAGLVVAGAAISGVGIAAVTLGLGFSAIATAIGFIGTALTLLISPAGLVVAALVAAVVAWAKFTASGQKVMAQIKETFGQIFETVKTTIKGIVDAISGGDLALAGQIAVQGLYVVWLEGMAGISNLITGEWKVIFDGIAGALSRGDISKAWDIAMKGLGKAWAQFAAWTVGTAAKMAKRVVEVWTTAVGGLAKSLLTKASKGGVFGAIMNKITGVDIQAEAERARRLNQKLGIKGDPMGEALADVDKQMQALQTKADDYLDNMVLSFQAAADEAGAAAASAAAPGAEAFREELEAERARLKELTSKAAAAAEKKRKEVAKAAAGGTGLGAEGDIAGALAATSTAGTFSAAALQRLASGGGGPVERMANDVAKHRKAGENMADDIAAIRRKGGPQFSGT